MSDDDHPTDISPTHFATRESDRGVKGVLMRLFDSLDGPAREELVRFAATLSERRRADGQP